MDNGKRIPYQHAIRIGKTFENKDILDADPLAEQDKKFRDNLLEHGFFHYFDKDIESTLANQKRYSKGKINKVFVKTDKEDKENPDGRYIELWYDGYIEDTPENIENLKNGNKYDNVSMGLWPSKINDKNEILDGVGVHSVLTPISAYGKVSKIYGKCSENCDTKKMQDDAINTDNSNLLNPIYASSSELLLFDKSKSSINIVNFSLEKTEDEKINLSQSPSQVTQIQNDVNVTKTGAEISKPIDTNKNFDANPENPLFNDNKQFYTKDDINKILEQKQNEWIEKTQKDFDKKFNEALESHTKKTSFFNSLTGNDEKKTNDLLKKYGKDSLSFDELQSFHKDINTLTKSAVLESTKKEAQPAPPSSEVEGDNTNTNTNANNIEPVGATADLIALALQKVGIIPNGNGNNNNKQRRTQFNGLEDLSLSELQGRLSA